MFSEVWRWNVHDVRKACHEMTMFVYVSFVEFYMFVFYETHVVGPKLLYKHIWGRNVHVRLHRGPKRVPKGGHQLRDQHCHVVAKRRTSWQLLDQAKARRWVSSMETTLFKV